MPGIRRVLIDSHGMVFVPTWGWSSLQDGSYKFKVFPEPISMWNLTPKFDMHWWEKRAWENVAWAWCYMSRPAGFTACSIQDGAVFAC